MIRAVGRCMSDITTIGRESIKMYHVKTFIERVDANGDKAFKTVVGVSLPPQFGSVLHNAFTCLCFPTRYQTYTFGDLRGAASSGVFGSRWGGQGQRGRGRGSRGNARGRGGVGSRGAGGSAD
eukprot:6214606-Pleurochrysis_carterae.AAC.1